MGQFSAGNFPPNAPHPEASPFAGMAPPTMPGEIPPSYGQSKWPKVLGIILIVLGSLAIVGSCFGTVALFAQDKLMDFAASAGKGNPAMQQEFAVQKTVIAKWQWASVGSNVLLMVCAVLCLVAGIGVLKRRASGVKYSKAWAGLKILAALVGAVIGYLLQRDLFQAMQQAGTSGGNVPPGMAGAMKGIQIAAVVFGAVWQCAMPVFVLVWFGRAKIREETSHWA